MKEDPQPEALGDKVREQVKDVLNRVLLESGLLQQIVDKAVEHKLEARGSGGASEHAEALQKEAANIAKKFLSENIGSLSKKEIQDAIGDSTQKVLSSENVKVLIDDKFRAVTLYLKTEVIPKSVRQALKEAAETVH